MTEPVGPTIPMDYESYFGSGHFANTGMPYLGRVLLVARLSDLDVLQSPRQFGKLVRATSSTSSAARVTAEAPVGM